MEFGANCLKNDLWPFFTVKHTHVLHTAAQLARDNIFLKVFIALVCTRQAIGAS